MTRIMGFILLVSIGVCCSLHAVAMPADESVAMEVGSDSSISQFQSSSSDGFRGQLEPFMDALSGRVEIGLRLTDYHLVDTERGDWVWDPDNYLGSINKLEKRGDPVGFEPYINYNFNRFITAGITHQKIEIDLVEKYDRYGDRSGDTDGSLVLSGPIIYLQGRWDNESIFTPYAESGIAFYSSSFEHDSEWRFSGGNSRMMIVEDEDVVTFALGLLIELKYGFSMDLYGRHADFDVRMSYYLNDDNRTGEPMEVKDIPAEHYTYGIGINYQF